MRHGDKETVGAMNVHRIVASGFVALALVSGCSPSAASVEQASAPACPPPPSLPTTGNANVQLQYFWGVPVPKGPWRQGASSTLVPEPSRVTAASVCLYEFAGDDRRAWAILRADRTLTLTTADAQTVAVAYNDDAVTKLPPGTGIAFIPPGWYTATAFAYDEGPTTTVTRRNSTAATNGKYRGYLLNTPMEVTPAPPSTAPTTSGN